MVLEKHINVKDADKIRELISQMEVIGCTQTFVKYMNECEKKESELGYLERKFFERLRDKLEDVRLQIELESVKDFKKYATELLIEGTYGFCEQCASEHLDSIAYFNDNTIAHPILVGAMTDAINEVEAYEIKTADEKAKAKKEHEIANYEQSIKDYQDRINHAHSRIAELKK